MIRTVRVEVNAAYPDMPLERTAVYTGSAASFTIINVPRKHGKRDITGVSVSVTNTAGATQSFSAVRDGCAWNATVPSSAIGSAGNVQRGIVIAASGIDENDGAVPCWILGCGDLVVMPLDAQPEPGESATTLRGFDETPSAPSKWNVRKSSSGFEVYYGGSWIAFGGGGGDVKHADFADIEEKEGMTLKEVGAMCNTLVRKLKGTVAAFAALLAFGAFADGVPLSPDMDFGDIHPTNKLKAVVEASGAISDVNTNAVIDIANATIATNPVVAAKLDGPTVSPTNTAEAAGKAADARLTGIALTNRYSKAESDAKLAEKREVVDMSVYKTTVRFIPTSEVALPDGVSMNDQPVFYEDGYCFWPTSNDEVFWVGEGTIDSNEILFEAQSEGINNFTARRNETLDQPPLAIDRLATTNGVQKVLEDNEGVGTDRNVVRGLYEPLDDYWYVTVAKAITADSVYFSGVQNKPTTLSGYGITDAAPLSMISADNPTFTNAVLQTVIPNLSTNITAEVYIAATNACANLGIDPALIPQGGTLGTVGGLLVALAAAVAILRKKTAKLDNSGNATDAFATDLLGKPVAIQKIDERTPYALVTGDLKDRSVKLYDATSAGVTVTLPTLATLPVGVTDFEAWIEMGAKVKTVTYSPDTIEWKDGKVPTTTDYTASATNIVHFTIVKTATATKVTACLAGFKAATPAA